MIDWRKTTYGTAPQGPGISYDEQGLPWRNIGGVKAGMAIRWAPEYGMPNTPVAIGGNDAANRNPAPPVWEEQENIRPIYDPPNPGSGPGGGGTGGGTQAPPVSWQPNPQTPQFGANQPDFGDMWTRQFDIGEGFSGRNKEFYDTQFSNLLAQQQGFQDNQLLAAMKHQNAVNNPQQPTAVDWSWANGGQGLPEVNVAGQPSWALQHGLGPDATNLDVINRVYPTLSVDAQDFWTRHMENPDAANSLQTAGFVNAGSPEALIRSSNLDPSAQPYLNELAMAIYRNTTPQTGPGNVPAGYAAPISGG